MPAAHASAGGTLRFGFPRFPSPAAPLDICLSKPNGTESAIDTIHPTRSKLSPHQPRATSEKLHTLQLLQAILALGGITTY